jgi:hypothetical protein
MEINKGILNVCTHILLIHTNTGMNNERNIHAKNQKTFMPEGRTNAKSAKVQIQKNNELHNILI